MNIEHRIKLIAEEKTPAKVNGVLIDTFTATMINTVAQKLSEDNKSLLFSKSINEIVALSYKIMTYRPKSTKPKNG
jgi:hypothetical protein